MGIYDGGGGSDGGGGGGDGDDGGGDDDCSCSGGGGRPATEEEPRWRGANAKSMSAAPTAWGRADMPYDMPSGASSGSCCSRNDEARSRMQSGRRDRRRHFVWSDAVGTQIQLLEQRARVGRRNTIGHT